MTVLRPMVVAVGLVVMAGLLFGWTVQEARRQRVALEEALTKEASLLADSLGPGLIAASNASRELDELILWKLLDNARLIGALYAAGSATRPDLEQLLEANGLDSIVIIEPTGDTLWIGEIFDESTLDDLAPLIDGEAEDLVLGSTMQHSIQHLAAAARIEEGVVVLVRVEWSTAYTFTRRFGVENLLLDLLGTGAVLYLSYLEEPGSLLVEGAWNGGPVPVLLEGGGLRTVYGKPIFEVNMALEAPAGSSANLRVGLDGSPLVAAARQTVARSLVTGLILAALAFAGTGLAFVSHYRSLERKQAVAKLAALETAKQRSQRLAAAGALTAGLAHEVRSPLNAIGLAAQRLERKLPDTAGGTRQMATGIGREVRRLEGVLRTFLDLASPVSGDRECVELSSIATEVVQLLEAEAEAEMVQLEPVRGSAVAMVDREAMRRALINLVRNAIQASPPDNRVSVSIASTNDQVQICVGDQGKGVAAEIADRVFDPFVTGRDAGTGLGLALVKRVVEEHGGTISLESSDRPGTLARIKLPLEGEAPV